MRKDSHRKKLARLTDILVDDILQTTDAEILSEVEDNGKSVKAEVNSLREILKKAEKQVAKSRLVSARAAIDRQKKAEQVAKGKAIRLSPEDARLALDTILRKHPESTQEFTLAARKGRDLSDTDVMSMLEDLQELGLYAPDDESEE